MSLSAQYQAFLASPSSGALAENASLHYITTLTTINDATAIIKHLSVQEKLLKKKAEKVLSAVEGANGICLDVETTLEFVAGGGAYLPGLDDNFVADRTVTFPTVHMVHFDKNQRIAQIRLYWDQGSLLKQTDVIGARSQNWPIRDGKDQARLIATSSSAVSQPESAVSSRRSTASRGPDEVSVTERPISSRRSTNNAMNDPHATLSLFEPREVNEETSASNPIAPRAQSAKPPARELSELFVGEDAPSPSPSDVTSSPSKRGIPVKSGGGKNFKPNRLFEEEEETAPTPLSVKTGSKMYNHFEFGDGEDTPKVRDTARPTSKSSKHQSQWDFEDFVTPNKPKPKVLSQAVRHFGWSDDEDDMSPVRRPIVHKARPDAEHHFEFVDDGTPDGQRKEAASKGRLHNRGLGLYKDHVLGDEGDDEDAPKGDSKRPLGDVTTTIKNENRKKDFGAHWEMTDDSPANTSRGIAIAGNGMGGRKGTEAHWALYEQSPEQSKKENVNTSRGYKAVGNGMGGRKDAESKSFWDF